MMALESRNGSCAPHSAGQKQVSIGWSWALHCAMRDLVFMVLLVLTPRAGASFSSTSNSVGWRLRRTSRSARRARLLEGDRGGLSEHQAPAVLGSQDRQRAEQSRPLGPAQHEGRPSRDLRRADPRGGRSGDRCVHHQIRRQVRQGGRRLTKDREALLAFFDFPAEHWDHLRTSNPIESVFATVRHRTVRTKGALSVKTAKLMVFKLINAAAKTWRRLKGENQLPKVVKGVKFQNGIEVIKMSAHHAA